MVQVPVPGISRTRAMASLRRPVPPVFVTTAGRLDGEALDGTASARYATSRSFSSVKVAISSPSGSTTAVTDTVSSSISLGDLGDRVRLGLLCSVRVLRTRVDLQLAQQLAAELVLREHAPHGALDDLAGILVQQLAVRDGLEAARTGSVAVGHLVGALRPRQGDLRRVDDDA